MQFDGKALASINYQRYTGHFSSGTGVTQEIEVSIGVIPKLKVDLSAKVDFEGYIRGEEQSKSIGSYRILVPCDDDLAINAGIQKFGEPKFKTNFQIEIPSLNGSTVQNWMVRCTDSTDQEIFTFHVDVDKLRGEAVNTSPHIYYGVLNNQLIGSSWNTFQPSTVYFLKNNDEGRVSLTFGDSRHAANQVLQNIFADERALAVASYESSPTATQGRAFYI